MNAQRGKIAVQPTNPSIQRHLDAGLISQSIRFRAANDNVGAARSTGSRQLEAKLTTELLLGDRKAPFSHLTLIMRPGKAHVIA